MADRATAAYCRLDEALREVLAVEEYEGLLTDWVVVVACQRIEPDGQGVTQVGTVLPDGGNSLPYHRMMGLLDYALTRCRSEICED